MPRGQHFKRAPEINSGNVTDINQLPSDTGVETPAVNVAPDAEIAKVFGNAPQVPTTTPNDTMVVDAKAFQNMMSEFNDLKKAVAQATGSPIDLHDLEKRQKSIRVGQYTDENGIDYLLVGLEEKTFRDGSRATTWNEGKETDSSGKEVPITWIQPRLINIETGVESSPKVQYVEFSNVLRTIPMKVTHEETIPVNMTTIEEVVDKVVYVDSKNGGLKGQGTGQQVKTSVWGTKSTFHVQYEGREYKIDDTVVNYK